MNERERERRDANTILFELCDARRAAAPRFAKVLAFIADALYPHGAGHRVAGGSRTSEGGSSELLDHICRNTHIDLMLLLHCLTIGVYSAFDLIWGSYSTSRAYLVMSISCAK